MRDCCIGAPTLATYLGLAVDEAWLYGAFRIVGMTNFIQIELLIGVCG